MGGVSEVRKRNKKVCEIPFNSTNKYQVSLLDAENILRREPYIRIGIVGESFPIKPLVGERESPWNQVRKPSPENCNRKTQRSKFTLPILGIFGCYHRLTRQAACYRVATCKVLRASPPPNAFAFLDFTEYFSFLFRGEWDFSRWAREGELWQLRAFYPVSYGWQSPSDPHKGRHPRTWSHFHIILS